MNDRPAHVPADQGREPLGAGPPGAPDGLRGSPAPAARIEISFGPGGAYVAFTLPEITLVRADTGTWTATAEDNGRTFRGVGDDQAGAMIALLGDRAAGCCAGRVGREHHSEDHERG
ncbi:hypothetical protein [Streptosporangium sp. NPDC002721]|uniref:hypothetical protein n=1 Tax=Streptosporangium sp. NPDC002721 TaxID=3366188 RepID=UPI00368AA51B